MLPRWVGVMAEDKVREFEDAGHWFEAHEWWKVFYALRVYQEKRNEQLDRDYNVARGNND